MQTIKGISPKLAAAVGPPLTAVVTAMIATSKTPLTPPDSGDDGDDGLPTELADRPVDPAPVDEVDVPDLNHPEVQ